MLGPSIDFHVQAQYALFKVPSELIKRNLKAMQKLVEKQRKLLAEQVARVNASPQLAQEKLIHVRKLMHGFKAYQRKLCALVDSDREYRARLQARVDNLAVLKQCCVRPDPKSPDTAGVLDLHSPILMRWYHDQTNLLIADYLLRSNRTSGHNVGSAFLDSLGRSFPDIRKLIDCDVLEQFNDIYLSIAKDHDLTRLVAWYGEHHANLKRAHSNLEFEIGYCRYLSYIENRDILGAIKYAQLHLSQYGNQDNYAAGLLENFERNLERLRPMGGLFVLALVDAVVPQSPSSWSSQILENTVALHQHRQLLQHGRWAALADYFVKTFTQYYGISASFPLHIYLSAGLTSLKTKSCYRNTDNTIFPCGADSRLDLQPANLHVPSTYYRELGKINHCPVCSPELFDLARLLPHAQLITHIFSQPYLLPNGNIYPFEKLLAQAKADNANDQIDSIKDPLTNESFKVSNCQRVYPA